MIVCRHMDVYMKRHLQKLWCVNRPLSSNIGGLFAHCYIWEFVVLCKDKRWKLFFLFSFPLLGSSFSAIFVSSISRARQRGDLKSLIFYGLAYIKEIAKSSVKELNFSSLLLIALRMRFSNDSGTFLHFFCHSARRPLKNLPKDQAYFHFSTWHLSIQSFATDGYSFNRPQ